MCRLQYVIIHEICHADTLSFTYGTLTMATEEWWLKSYSMQKKNLLWEQYENVTALQSHPKSSKKLLMQYEAKLMRF